MKISTAGTTDHSLKAIGTLYASLIKELGDAPSLVIVSCSMDYDIEGVVKTVLSQTPDVVLHGGTSCMGAMTQNGIVSENGSGLAFLCIFDPEGRYGVGSSPVGDDPSRAAELATFVALEKADCPGEVPAMIWLTTVPGCEEAMLSGIGNVIGNDVPVVGGSSADNAISGKWKQFDHNGVYIDGVVVTALFPSTEPVFAFHSGYEPTETKGIVTTTGNRTIFEINGRPAASVYNAWVDGAIEDALEKGGNIMKQTALAPLGRIAGFIGEIPYYQLTHPASITPQGAIALFSDINQGDEITLMHGTIDSLISRAGRVAASALETSRQETHEVAGALIVYCAGCMFAVQERLDEVVESFKGALPGIPFLGTFSFGEQGCLLTGENRHGNLMISVLLLLKN
jgi:hypothetical protein